MKIIGIAGESKLILEAERNDVARLCGYYYAGSRGCPTLEVGVTVNISKIYEQLYKLASAHGSLNAAQATLRSIADLLAVVDPLIPPFEK